MLQQALSAAAAAAMAAAMEAAAAAAAAAEAADNERDEGISEDFTKTGMQDVYAMLRLMKKLAIDPKPDMISTTPEKDMKEFKEHIELAAFVREMLADESESAQEEVAKRWLEKDKKK
jgi:signal transduction histidine kinase